MSEGKAVVEAEGTPALPALKLELTDDKLISVAKFTEAERTLVADVAAGVDIADSNAIITYGAPAQRKFSAFLDQMLEGVSKSSVGAAGEITVALARNLDLVKLRRMRLEADGRDWVAKWFGDLPWVGKYASAFRYFQLMHGEIVKSLAEVETKANIDMGRLQGSTTSLDKLLEATDRNLRDLEIAVAAGQQALLRMRGEFAARREEVARSRDPVEFARLRDMAEQINAFETRVVRMQLAFMDGVVSIPQIRTAQTAARIETSNILDSILFDLPALKGAIIRVAALKEISSANAATKARRKVRREIAQLGADALHDAYTEAKRSQGDAMDDVATLETVIGKLLGTIEKGNEIDNANRAVRAKAQQELVRLKGRLLTGMAKIADDMLKDPAPTDPAPTA